MVVHVNFVRSKTNRSPNKSLNPTPKAYGFWRRVSSCVGCKIAFLTYLPNVLQCLTMGTLTIRLPDELKADLQKFSQEQNKPVSDVVRESIRRYVAIEKFRAIRKKVLPFAEAQGFLTDEDVFKAIS